jgi:predicted acyl esterase
MHDRNPNTGVGQSGDVQGAQQTIHHDAEYPSKLTLPLVRSLGDR